MARGASRRWRGGGLVASGFWRLWWWIVRETGIGGGEEEGKAYIRRDRLLLVAISEFVVFWQGGSELPISTAPAVEPARMERRALGFDGVSVRYRKGAQGLVPSLFVTKKLRLEPTFSSMVSED